jgi:putative endonuclease
MSDYRQKLGKKGEDAAAHFLTQKGYKILRRNYRSGRSEIDIIALDGETVVFVEVKTRETDKYGSPEEAVSKAKQRMLLEGAEAYLDTLEDEVESRYDIISVIINQYKTEITHLEDAFWPGLF